MLHTLSISWNQYLAVAAVLVGCYYAGVAIVYFRAEIKAFLQSRSKSAAKHQQNQEKAIQQEMPVDKLEQLVHEIDGLMEESGRQINKADMLSRITNKLKDYQGLQHPAYKIAIYNHVIKQAEDICGLRISVEELEQVG